jgi:hypothetical protein
MPPLPAAPLRTNLGTWAVPDADLPAVAAVLIDALPTEPFDPAFRGQELETTYFDTPDFALRKARRRGDTYLTLRVRCYRQGAGREAYALSAKTEKEKWRTEVAPETADLLLESPSALVTLLALLPADLAARLLDLAGEQEVRPVACVGARRYAVEGPQDRLTLDVGVGTDSGKELPFHVLELKSADAGSAPPGRLPALALRPIKLSKFLWATEV